MSKKGHLKRCFIFWHITETPVLSLQFMTAWNNWSKHFFSYHRQGEGLLGGGGWGADGELLKPWLDPLALRLLNLLTP